MPRPAAFLLGLVLLLLLLCLTRCTRPTARPTPWEQRPVGLTLAQSDSTYAKFRF